MEGYIWLHQVLQLPPVRPKTCLYITGGPQRSLSRSWLPLTRHPGSGGDTFHR